MQMSSIAQQLNYNYPQIPSYYFQNISRTLTKSESLVMEFIFMKTLGWHKTYDRISLSQFEENTKLSRYTICKSIKSLIDKKLIVKHAIKNGLVHETSIYSLVIENISGCKKEFEIDQGGVVSFVDQGVVSFLHPQKKPKSKEKNIKDLGLAKSKNSDLGLDPLAEQLLSKNVGLMTQTISNKQQTEEISLEITDEIEAMKAECSEDLLHMLLDNIIQEVKAEDTQEIPEITKEEPKKKSDKTKQKIDYREIARNRTKSKHNCYYDKNHVTKRFKLTEEQIEKFEFLKSQKITYGNKTLVPEEKLCFVAKMDCHYQRLVDIVIAVKSNYSAESELAYMKSLIIKESVVPNNDIKTNKKFAEDFAASNNWHQLKINKNYATFNLGNSVQEINFNMSPFDFIRTLTEKYENSAAYS